MVPLTFMQVNWIKSMQPLVPWVVHCKEDVVSVIRHMEEHSNSVSPYGFKVLEAFRVRDDYEELCRQMMMPLHKPNPARLRSVAMAILKERGWSWNLCHPELTVNQIHPSRSMFMYHHTSHAIPMDMN